MKLKFILPVLFASSCLYASNETIYLTVHNDSQYALQLKTGLIFTHTYDIAPEDSLNTWYFTGIVWRVNLKYMNENNKLMSVPNFDTFLYYNKSFTINCKDSKVGNYPTCRISNY